MQPGVTYCRIKMRASDRAHYAGNRRLETDVRYVVYRYGAFYGCGLGKRRNYKKHTHTQKLRVTLVLLARTLGFSFLCVLLCGWRICYLGLLFFRSPSVDAHFCSDIPVAEAMNNIEREKSTGVGVLISR